MTAGSLDGSGACVRRAYRKTFGALCRGGSWLWLAAAVAGVVGCGGRSHGQHAAGEPNGVGGSAGATAGAGASSGTAAAGGAPSAELCACPEAPTDTWVADESCVYGDGGYCRPSLQQALGSLVADTGGFWYRGCGRSVTVAEASDGDGVSCVYDDSGAFVGAYRTQPAECPGVGTIATADVAGACSDQTACWLGPGGDPAVMRCDDGGVLAPECIAYDRLSQSAAAFERLGDVGTTLESYLSSIFDGGSQSYFGVLTGCGITALTTYGLGSSSVAFDASGQFIGFRISGDSDFGPCRVPTYRRGVVPPDGCASGYHACPLAADALDTGVACACPCPTDPPADGIVTTSPECVATVAPLCGETASAELATLDQLGGRVQTSCGEVTTTRLAPAALRSAQGQLVCTYAASGALLNATHFEPNPGECQGVRAWTNGQPSAIDCQSSTTCWRGPSPPADVPACGN